MKTKIIASIIVLLGILVAVYVNSGPSKSNTNHSDNGINLN